MLIVTVVKMYYSIHTINNIFIIYSLYCTLIITVVRIYYSMYTINNI